ncbi:hypothetical protein BJ878DRAFT_543948 [Calycina marina]|uniref:SMAD/FHA domain-containing protein n=1 Tax=Calycina marina TaxID=1763456 RepID=A0A9P7YZT2_9HELO|nr:hypothetical protein BJ878DRAFT_543948 [Calycina marina]
MFATALAPRASPAMHPGTTNGNLTSPSSTSTTSARPAIRSRGLSTLRKYTHNHLLSRDNHSTTPSNDHQPSVTRNVTSPASLTSKIPTSIRSPTGVDANFIEVAQLLPSPRYSSTRSSNPGTNSVPSGGLSTTVAGESGAPRTGPETQQSFTPSPTAATDTPSLSEDKNSPKSQAMGRTQSSPADGATRVERPQMAHVSMTTSTNGGGMSHQLPSIQFITFQDPRAARPSLIFNPIQRILPTGREIIRVGRYSERDTHPPPQSNIPSSAPVGFKSKVVSRRHCEFWCQGGSWFVKDAKSSSGTFLNHIRLSSPNTESKPFPVNDGDIVQLGIDFKGGEEMMFRCVKIRISLNKGWQQTPSSFNVKSHKQLRELNSLAKPGSSQDCSICLGAIAPCQSLFVAPCSHTWHYKCIRIIINGPHWPHFICPNCRTVADLEADIDEPEPEPEEEWEKLEVDEDTKDQTTMGTVSQTPAQATEEFPHPSEEHKSAHSSNINSNSDGEVVEISDESDARNTDASEAMGYMNINDGTPSPISSVGEIEIPNNATVQPVNIGRKAVPFLGGISSQFEQTPTNDVRMLRTPSPNELPSSLMNALSHGEGPMTPRNDAGPFVFDGSGGTSRASGSNIANIASTTSLVPNTCPMKPFPPPS